MSENPAAEHPDDERVVDDAAEETDEEAPADTPADPYREGGYETPEPSSPDTERDEED